MKLVLTQDLSQSKYKTIFSLEEVAPFEQEMLDDYAGVQELNIGGDIVKKEMVDDGAGGTKEQITTLLPQPDKFIKFVGGLPFEKTFLVAQYGKVKTREIAEAYNDMIVQRVEAIIAELKASPDTFTGVREIPL